MSTSTTRGPIIYIGVACLFAVAILGGAVWTANLPVLDETQTVRSEELRDLGYTEQEFRLNKAYSDFTRNYAHASITVGACDRFTISWSGSDPKKRNTENWSLTGLYQPGALMGAPPSRAAVVKLAGMKDCAAKPPVPTPTP